MNEISSSENHSRDFNRFVGAANAKSFSLEALKKELEEEKAKREGNVSPVSTRDEKNDAGEKKKNNSEPKKSKKSSIEITRKMIIGHLMTLKHYASTRKSFFNVIYSNPENRFGLLFKVLGSGVWAKFFKAVLSDKLLAWILK